MAQTQDESERNRDQKWQPYKDSWLEVSLWGFLFIKLPSNKFEKFPQHFYGMRWLLLSPFRLRIGLPLIGEWSIGEILMAAFIVAISTYGAVSTYGLKYESGKMAEYPMLFAYMLASRNSVWALIFGLPFERAIFWHQLCAWMSVILGALHGISVLLPVESVMRRSLGSGNAKLDNGKSITGLNFQIFMGALCLLGWAPIRRKFFELWLRSHWILFLLAAYSGLSHDVSLVFVALVFWGIDVVYRYLYMAKMRNPKMAKIEKLPGDLVKLSFPKDKFLYRSGQYVFVCVPELTLFEWHPFSFSSSPQQDLVTIHIRVLGDWTKNLHKLAEEFDSQEIKVFFEGPFGSPAVDLDGETYEHFFLISGGIGVTPMQSICNDLMYQYLNEKRSIQKIWFIWSVRDKVLTEDLGSMEKVQDTRLPHSFSPNTLTHMGSSSRIELENIPVNSPSMDGEVLISDFHLTSPRAEDEHEKGNIRTEVMPNLKIGRPDFKLVFEEMAKIATQGADPEKKRARVAVCVCGPSSLMKDISSLCLQKSNKEVCFDFHGETFAL
mmetsp:Transcript_34115/g.45095  ORF Transcript_34115/g.45095 Transcript_34115/m.45095 type:complete len:550 (-) Transcript_34115:347-1996(-)